MTQQNPDASGNPTNGAGDATLQGGAAPAGDASTTTITPPAGEPNAPAQNPAPEDGAAPDGSQAPGDGDGDGKPQETQKMAPEKYEFNAPDGVTYNPEFIGLYETAARELDLSQDQAATMLSKLQPELARIQQAQFDQAVTTTRKGWLEETQADPEIGGEKSEEKISIANKAVAKFGSPALVELLKETGLGLHKEVIRAFYKMGLAISEDTMMPGTNPGSSEGERAFNAKDLYPNSNMS